MIPRIFILYLIVTPLALFGQDNTYNGISETDYVAISKDFVEGFKTKNFDVISGHILSDSIETAREFFLNAIDEGEEDGITWSKVEFKYRVVFNEISTGNNPTKYDIASVDQIIAARKNQNEYSFTIWAVCAHSDRLIELELGTFYEIDGNPKSDGEFYYYDEPSE